MSEATSKVATSKVATSKVASSKLASESTSKTKSESTYEATAKIFKAFCDENRLKIIELLRNGEKCGCTLQEQMPICQSTLSHHMKILVDSGIVQVRKDRKWSYYSLSDGGAEGAKNQLVQLLTKTDYDPLPCVCKLEDE